MVRLILKGSGQITQDEWGTYYNTIEVDSEKLEEMLKDMNVVGAEVIK